MKRTILRWSVYLLGLVSLAFGIALSVKANLGISPISSVAYCIATIWDHNLGMMNFIVYASFVVVQFVLRGKNCRIHDLLQLAVSLVFSWVMDKLVGVIPYDSTQHTIWGNLALMLVAVVFIGVGVSCSLNMRLIPNPGEGIVQTLSETTGWSQGLTKNVFDIGCACVTTIISLVFAGRLIGVGIGTVAAMLGAGRVVALFNHFVMKKLRVAAGVA